MLGLDTTAIIDIFKGEPKIKGFLEVNKEPLAVAIMSYLELFFGINPEDTNHIMEGKYYGEFFRGLYNIDLTKESCEEASRIYWTLKKEGKTIEQFDCVIAASFLKSGISKILTRNRKHFKNIKRLDVISY